MMIIVACYIGMIDVYKRQGPTGKLLQPMGDLSFEDSYAAFKEMAVAGERAGADLILIETMSDLYEAKAALRCV